MTSCPAERISTSVERKHSVFAVTAFGPAIVGAGAGTVAFAFIDRPLALIVPYTVVASFIVPFIAVVLLYLNTRVNGQNMPAATRSLSMVCWSRRSLCRQPWCASSEHCSVFGNNEKGQEKMHSPQRTCGCRRSPGAIV